MNHYVYVLQSVRYKSLYIGLTNNPERRLYEHNIGNSKYTKGRRPYILLYKEKFDNRNKARNRERYFKSGVGRDELKKLIPL